jgi:hypothetical protein
MPITRYLLFCLVFILVGLGATGCNDDEVLVSTSGRPLPGAQAQVQLVPAQSSYQVGETVVVEVTISNAANVGSVAFHLVYNDDVLQFLAPAAEGPFMGSDGTATVFLAAEAGGRGEVVVGMSRIGAPQGVSGAGTLATFRFLATGLGTCDLRFTGLGVKDPQARVLPALFRLATVDVVP